MYEENQSPESFAKAYLERQSKILKSIDINQIAQFINLILVAREEGKTVFFMGNGGSASTASHFVNDISVGSRSAGKPFKSIGLTDNVAVISAIANDYSYEDVFIKQLSYVLAPGDLVVGISCSGNSENILRAIAFAKEQKATTIGFTGFDGGKLKTAAQYNVHVPSVQGEYGQVEDIHMIINHILASYLFCYCLSEANAIGD